MDCRLLCAVLLLVLVVVPFATSMVLQPSDEADSVAEVNAKTKSPRALFYLGIIDGKGFFVENSTTMSWTDAKALCTSAGLRLAEITSSAQHSFVFQKLLPRVSYPYYWTGGRDAQTEAQFVWNSNGSPLTRYGSTFSATSISTAVTLYISSSTSAYFLSQPITHSRHVLCEAV